MSEKPDIFRGSPAEHAAALEKQRRNDQGKELAWSAVQSAAEKLGRDAVAYAEGLELASAIHEVQYVIDCLADGDTGEALIGARAALSLLQGDSS